MGLETAASQTGGREEKKSVSASCGQVSWRPSGNTQVAAKEKVDYFNSGGCSRGRWWQDGGEEYFPPSKDLKINARPPHPRLPFLPFAFLSSETTCKPAVLPPSLFFLEVCGRLFNSEQRLSEQQDEDGWSPPVHPNQVQMFVCYC